jgi:hypothetical protein
MVVDEQQRRYQELRSVLADLMHDCRGTSPVPRTRPRRPTCPATVRTVGQS